MKNASITVRLHPYQISDSSREDPETRFFKNKLKLNWSIFLRNGSCYPIQIHIRKKQNVHRLRFIILAVIKNILKRIAFANAYKSSIIYQFFYMPTFLPNLRLMRPHSLVKIGPVGFGYE